MEFRNIFNKKTAPAPAETTPEPIKFLKKNWIPQTLQRVKQDVGKWHSALRTAENPLNPNRFWLYQIYNDCILDPHLSSLINTRKNKIQSKQFKLVDKAGVENEEATRLLNQTWFSRFVYHALDAQLWGHSLIEFGIPVDGKFSSVDLVDRIHVKPEFHLVVQNFTDNEGWDYLEDPLNNWLLEVQYNSSKDLGLLNKVAPFILYKRHSIAAWAEYAEVYASPLRVGKTDATDEETRSNMQNMLIEMGTSNWGLFDHNDSIEFIESNGKSGDVYEKLCKYIDEQVSKLVLGGTMVSDNGSSRSQSEVHERTSEEYAQADMQFIAQLVNDKLIPFMIAYHGFKLDGLEFVWDHSEKLSINEQFAIDAKLLDYFDLPADYILKKYGVPVVPKAAPVQDVNLEAPKNFSPRNFL